MNWHKRECVEIIRMIEEAEEAYVDTSLRDRFDRLESILNVIHKRAKGLFLLTEYIAKDQKERGIKMHQSAKIFQHLITQQLWKKYIA